MESSHHRRSARLNALAALSLVLVMGSQVPRAWGGTGIIITVAGGGSVGDGGQATGAQLFLPMGATVDATGNLFIADTAHHRIRRVTAGTGIITTVAGTGAMGFSGDGGPAPSAQLNSPIGVAIDAAGNLFIADASNHRIRRVAAGSGIITTVAGTGAMGFSGDDGLATSAQLNSPIGVAVDAAGDLFIADAYNHRIRRVAVSTGIITTVAGTGESGFSGDGGPATSAQVDTPTGVAIDAVGNLFIADADNHRIRRVAAGTGLITTVAGTGIPGFSDDGSPATRSHLSNPTGIAIDVAGNLFIADTESHRIRRVAVGTARITTIAGTGIPGFSGDGGPATDPVV